MRRIRISVGDMPYNTKVVDDETGTEIASVYRVEVTLDVNQVPSATIYTYMPVLDGLFEANIKETCPLCGKEQ